MREAEATHGSLDHKELALLGLRAEDIVDFSASINPYGPAPEVLEAIKAADVARYPDRECLALRQRIAEETGIGTEGIICGNGSAELIDLLARSNLKPQDASLIIGPTFSEYERATRISGAETLHFDRRISDSGATLDVEETISTVTDKRPRLVWLCNPNNPTGDYLPGSEVKRILHAVRTFGGILIVDEAYRNLMPDRPPDDLTTLLCGGGIVLLRSLTKSHALAGIRLGYALAPRTVITGMTSLRVPWTVSSPAQAAGVAAFSQAASRYVEERVGRMSKEMKHMKRDFARLGFSVVPGAANYLLVNVAGVFGSGGRARSLLLEEGVLVRDCASFGLPEYIRVAARLPGERRRLVAALRKLCDREGGV